MGKLQKLQCDNCGGHIDGRTLVCQSCGMEYMLNEDFSLHRIEVTERRLIVLEGKVAVPAYLVRDSDDLQELSEMTLRDMSEKMAKKLLPFMEFQTLFNGLENKLETYAKISVAEPNINYTHPNVFRSNR